jgi:Galactose oxidase, central domain
MKTESTLVWLLTLSLMFHLTGCGSRGAAPVQPTVARAATISSLSPSSAIAGGSQFTLTVNGANFVSGAVVAWNGNNRATTFVSSTQLSATILAGDIATPGTANVAVLNPPNSVSNGSAFGITAVGAPKFASTGNMIRTRAAQSATLLPNGQVLIVDGGQLDIDDLLVSTVSAELFDPSLGSFASTGSPLVARENHTATLLLNGKVLIIGGNEFNGYPTWLTPTATAELYDPATGTFAKTGNMAVGRTNHTASLLADGRVLVIGGATNVGSGTATTTVTLASTEIYDPGTETFAPAGNMASPRAGHTATMLPSGKVLITGGQNDQTAQATAEVFDPQTNSFTVTGSMVAPRIGHTATLLINGKVLVVGGATGKTLYPGVLSPAAAPQTTAELYDPLTGRFVATARMAYGRIAHTATVLPNGTVLISGGFNDYSPSAGYESYNSAETYDPALGSFINTAPMSTGRFWHTATLLPNGAVLITGGIGGDLELASAEIFK